MPEALTPGLAALVELTKDDPNKDWLINEIDQVAQRALARGTHPYALLAVLASVTGFLIGHGARRRRDRPAMENAVLLAESIMNDSAEDAFRKI